MIPTLVTFKWKSKKTYRSVYDSGRVNILYTLLKRHYPQMQRFVCVTDDPKGLNKGIETYPIWSDHAEIPNPTWENGPSCFRRLKVFDPWFESVAGPRFAMIDIDMVPVGDLTPIFERPEPFVIWRPKSSKIKFCASLILMDAGVCPLIWTGFDPTWALDSMKAAGCRGSDQGWLQLMLGDVTPGFTQENGVYGYAELAHYKPFPPSGLHRTHYRERKYRAMVKDKRLLPPDARLVIFAGKPDPWEPEAKKMSPWLKDHYRV